VRSIELERPEPSIKTFGMVCRQELEQIQRGR